MATYILTGKTFERNIHLCILSLIVRKYNFERLPQSAYQKFIRYASKAVTRRSAHALYVNKIILNQGRDSCEYHLLCHITQSCPFWRWLSKLYQFVSFRRCIKLKQWYWLYWWILLVLQQIVSFYIWKQNFLGITICGHKFWEKESLQWKFSQSFCDTDKRFIA